MFVALAACGDDAPLSYEINLSVSDLTAAASGSPVTISVGVRDEKTHVPAPTNSVVALQCAVGNELFGQLGASETLGQATVRLDTIGLASTSFRCTGDPAASLDVQCIAAFEDAFGVLAFRCVP
ncbi:MAG: hypothetical protein H6699_10680 [Myxococcales bacterium]|nr:hypothetical protein [Myxococcales bacterium]